VIGAASIERAQARSRASVEAPFIVSTRNAPRESAAAIRAKNRFWRAPMRRDAGAGENFFIAKNRDSESTQRVFGRRRRVAMGAMTLASQDEELQKCLRRRGLRRY
jgi:hypothetical protein